MTASTSDPLTSGVHDFDFFHGEWRVRHHRLKVRLAGNDEWQDFEGRGRNWPILGGAGNVDDNLLELPGETYRAISLRSFDPATGLWSIWWLDGRHPERLDPPLTGGFEGNVGTFYGDDVFECRPIKIRFIWSDVDTPTPRWEQAFSVDDGATWEVNWVMTFERIA